jgi:putative DNA primase/helicase
MNKKSGDYLKFSDLSDSEKSEIVQRVQHLFISRTDVYAEQRVQGKKQSYYSVKQALTEDVLGQHFKGEETIGIYQIEPKTGRVKWGVLDIDGEHVADAKAKTEKLWLRLVNAGVRCNNLLMEESGSPNSYHVWIFFETSTGAKEVKEFLERIAKPVDSAVEIFPKQERISTDGFGNLVKLPFGFHKGAKKWSVCYIQTEEGERVAGFDALKHVEPGELPERTKRKTTGLRPCFVNAIEEKRQLEGAEGDNYRLALVNECIGNGYTDEEIHSIFRLQRDYKHEITQQKIEYSRQNYGRRWTCETIRDRAPTLLAGMCDSCTWNMMSKSKGLQKNKKASREAYAKNIESVLSALTAKYRCVTADDTEQIYLYQDGYYVEADQILKAEIEIMLGAFTTNTFVNEILGHVQRSTYVKRTDFNKEKHLLPLENGIFNLRTFELEPFDEEIILTYKLPITYNPDVVAPNIIKWIKEIVADDENLKLIQEYLGYCFYPDVPLHKSLWTYGTGRNGKTQLFDGLLKRAIGDENTAIIPLEQLQSRFALANLFGKFINICSEPATKKPLQTPRFKQLTGGDSIAAEVKNKQKWVQFTNTAKFIILGNHFPEIDDDSVAWWERVEAIEFPNDYSENFVDNITDKLIEKDGGPEIALAGFFNWCLEGLQRLIENGFHLTKSKSSKETMQEFKRVSDPIGAFIDSMIKYDVNGVISKADLYNAYKEYCDAEEIEIKEQGALTKKIKQLRRVSDRKMRYGEDKKIVWCWCGISLFVGNVDNVDQSLLPPNISGNSNSKNKGSNTHTGIDKEERIYAGNNVNNVNICANCSTNMEGTNYNCKSPCDDCLSKAIELDETLGLPGSVTKNFPCVCGAKFETLRELNSHRALCAQFQEQQDLKATRSEEVNCKT